MFAVSMPGTCANSSMATFMGTQQNNHLCGKPSHCRATSSGVPRLHGSRYRSPPAESHHHPHRLTAKTPPYLEDSGVRDLKDQSETLNRSNRFGLYLLCNVLSLNKAKQPQTGMVCSAELLTPSGKVCTENVHAKSAKE